MRIIFLFSYYNKKIIDVKDKVKETRDDFFLESIVEAQNTENYYPDDLFENIENVMKNNLLYKNVSFNISELSFILKTNSNYISRSIKGNGFSNFNDYVNSYRIDYVKKSIQEQDLNKVTLLYIYTDAGFLNQSTFNRVFKKNVGVIPSEYIRSAKSV